MPSFSKSSSDRLATCDPRLQRLFNRVVKTSDCTIVCGHRGKAAQNKAFDEEKSELRWPDGNHNAEPSKAVDAAPWYPGVGIVWNHPSLAVVRENATLFAGYVLGVASEMGVAIRWGGDWNGNFDTADNNFDDLWHFEIIE